MNKPICIIFCAAVMYGCGGKSEAPVQETPAGEYVQVKADETHRMEEYRYTDIVEWRGGHYEYTVTRVACDSLGVAKDDDGMRYVENIATLTVKRDGAAFFSRTFTKDMFDQYVPADFMKRSVLEGIAFNRAADDGLRFTMAIGLPISDEYVQLRLTISSAGQLSVKRDEILDDTLADDDSMFVYSN